MFVIQTGDKPSRLVNGSHLCTGRVEILHDQTWMSVCDAAFDQQDAEVVCRQLDVGLLYRCWEQLLLTKETLRCGHKRFSAEEMNLRFHFAQYHHHTNTTAPVTTLWD